MPLRAIFISPSFLVPAIAAPALAYGYAACVALYDDSHTSAPSDRLSCDDVLDAAQLAILADAAQSGNMASIMPPRWPAP